MKNLTNDQRNAVIAAKYRWRLWARPEQIQPKKPHVYWIYLAGRGAGKTRAGAEWIRHYAKQCPRLSLIGATTDDVRDIMVEGESGILATSPPWFRPEYQPWKRRVVWPNGSIARIYTAHEPERLRGHQHERVWADELCAWRHDRMAWDMMVMGLRLGRPGVFVSTTPKPRPLLKELLKNPSTVVTRGTSYDNIKNLAPVFISEVLEAYKGTRLGRQEIDGELIEDNPGALWRRDDIEASRISQAPALVRIVVGVDPATTSKASSNSTGIVVAAKGADGHYYVLDDSTVRSTPAGWGKAVVAAYERHKADRIVAEGNQGGEMVSSTIATVQAGLPVKIVHATQGKRTRAEPISSLYEQGKVHHVGTFPYLEDEMCQWDPTDTEGGKQDSPDRVDALVWALTELHKKPEPRQVAIYR